MIQIFRRRRRILIVLVSVTVIFLIFQLFSFKVLNLYQRLSHSENVMKKDVIINLDLIEDSENILNDKHVSLEDEQMKWNSSLLLPHGVLPSQAKFYMPDKDYVFQCLYSKEQIPFSQVNDDFCDCKDSSDEPGTAACPNSMFYCTFQLHNKIPRPLPPSRVNDGICDCCDGSDEWIRARVPEWIIQLGKSKKFPLSYAPCENKCEKVEHLKQEDDKIRKLGSKLKITYLEAGRKAINTDLYGPGGVFYKLGQSCFDFKLGEYEYNICPFKNVRQRKFPSAWISLGIRPVWDLMNEGLYVLQMVNGDSNLCPEHIQRSTAITFICGLSDRVLQVSEDDKCKYIVQFSTPAAC
ncbi:hypothetical protein CHS0354_017582 [Potamilus streckersoni]|uniref:Glucosidase 2 subunit beta n=1 Tax=Potamilus streckersoni TaxID=2493646 RepID=A0AAE0RPG9_9BIVA|nr:hypothetical protein CHS0354_017582 [Potamilus streckersoni]